MLVLAIPFVDTAFTIIRRTYRRQPISMADRGHLHHLLITFGHSHRRAVIVLYYWSAVIAGGVIAGAVLDRALVLLGGALALLIGLGLTVIGIRWRPEREQSVPVSVDRSA